MGPSAAPPRLPLFPDDHATTATEPPSKPVSAPRGLDKSDTRLKGGEGVHHEARRAATEGPTLDTKGRKGAAAPEEYETRPKDSATISDGTKRRQAEPNPTSSYTPNVIQQTYSSDPSSGTNSTTPRLSEMGKSREKVGQFSDSAPSSGKKGGHISPPPLALLSTQNQPKHVIRVSSNSDSTVSSVEPRPSRPRPPSVCDSEIPVTPSGMSPLFFTAFRLTPDSLLLYLSHLALTIVETSSNLTEGHGFQALPGFLSKIGPSTHESNVSAPLGEQHHYERLEKTFPCRLPIPSGRITNELTSPSHVQVHSQRGPASPNNLQVHSGGIMKQISSSNLNPAKLQQGGLNRGYSL
jgi:hypothetical protein